MLTSEQVEKFISEAASRFVEVGGMTKGEAIDAARSFDAAEWINDGYDGVSAADEDMSYWDADE